MKLVIAEKPSVGAAIAAALGVTGKKDGYIENNGYIISWCVGHLVGLAEAAAYGEQYKKWDYDSLPILPQDWKYTIAADKGKQFKNRVWYKCLMNGKQALTLPLLDRTQPKKKKAALPTTVISWKVATIG